MPLGPFPLPEFDTPPRPAREPSRLWARMRTRWRRNQLDDELSAGADPRASAELSVPRPAASLIATTRKPVERRRAPGAPRTETASRCGRRRRGLSLPPARARVAATL